MIVMNNVSTGYDKDNPLLKKFSYEFTSNKIYGILGRSGCGKTTLLRTIVGLLKPLEGEILIDSKQYKKPQDTGIYMMHQGYTCFDWRTVLDNVLIAKQVRGRVSNSDLDKAKEFLRIVRLDGNENKYPTQLSGGMRQRLSLARTLFMNPKIILMDEPLSALDEELRKDMQDLLLDQHQKFQNTIIMVTHSKDEANRLCDDVIDLNTI